MEKRQGTKNSACDHHGRLSSFLQCKLTLHTLTSSARRLLLHYNVNERILQRKDKKRSEWESEPVSGKMRTVLIQFAEFIRMSYQFCKVHYSIHFTQLVSYGVLEWAWTCVRSSKRASRGRDTFDVTLAGCCVLAIHFPVLPLLSGSFCCGRSHYAGPLKKGWKKQSS